MANNKKLPGTLYGVPCRITGFLCQSRNSISDTKRIFEVGFTVVSFASFGGIWMQISLFVRRCSIMTLYWIIRVCCLNRPLGTNDIHDLGELYRARKYLPLQKNTASSSLNWVVFLSLLLFTSISVSVGKAKESSSDSPLVTQFSLE